MAVTRIAQGAGPLAIQLHASWPFAMSFIRMIDQPEIVRVNQAKVVCDGAAYIAEGAALGHPRVWLEIDESGYVDCGYCDRRFILVGGIADVERSWTRRENESASVG